MTIKWRDAKTGETKEIGTKVRQTTTSWFNVRLKWLNTMAGKRSDKLKQNGFKVRQTIAKRQKSPLTIVRWI